MSWKLKEKLRGRLAREKGARQKDWGGKVSVCLVYPNEYRIGMGNLAVHAIYDILNRRGDIVCERAFLPDAGDIPIHRRGDAPIMSLESQRPLPDFDAIAFTISFENDYLNILPMLSMSKIPYRVNERDESMPLVIAGGAAPTLNPEPILEIFDSVILGEFEAYADDLPQLFVRKVEDSGQRSAVSDQLRAESQRLKANGRWSTDRRYVENLDDWPTQTIIYNDSVEFGNMHLIEVERGCPRGCKFCATPSLYRPFRFRSAEIILKMVDVGLNNRNRFGLIGADILSHPEFIDIATAIHARGAAFSPSSVRVDAIDDIKARLLSESRHRSIALGIEAGGRRLREKIGKDISDDRILGAIECLSRNGITRIRPYFMIGLPGETDGDIDAIARLSRGILEVIRKNAPKGEGSHLVDITVSPFIPKPNTPFEGENFAGEECLKIRIDILKRALKNERGITVHFDSTGDAAIEALLAKGGRETFAFLEDAFMCGNARRALKAAISAQRSAVS